ncbi:MAG: ExbD/TolR family protein [Isosphaeraceae bacterium]
MARSTRRTSGLISPNLTPLLDVVLQLITFFMMLIHFGTRLEGENRRVRLPVAPAALPGSDLTFDRLPVALDRRGQLLVEGRALLGAEASAWWSRQASDRRAGLELLHPGETVVGASQDSEPDPGSEELPTVVILRADRDASYGAVRWTLAEAQERGFAQFSLVVLRSGKS